MDDPPRGRPHSRVRGGGLPSEALALRGLHEFTRSLAETLTTSGLSRIELLSLSVGWIRLETRQ
ncbi:MAG: hypothetical protein A07HR60_02337 [uncultured archaeon A07HR60]|nr:MAG: hypothetical protein A07HR60_02337 [uncultured archaeon A07HR60]